MVQRLILKDWHLSRLPIILSLAAAVAGLILMAIPRNPLPTIGLTLIANVLIALTFYLPLATILGERTEKTLPFIMSLPVSPADYTAAKILANILLYLIPWAAIILGVLIISSEGSGTQSIAFNGHWPLALVGCLVFFSFILSFAITTESTGWTIAAIVVFMFVFGNVGLQLLPRVPAADRFLAAAAAQGPELWTALLGELGLIVLLLGATFYRQVRKRDFI